LVRFFCSVCCLMCMTLEMTYFRAELDQLIVSRSNSEPKVQRYGMKKNTDCWSYHAARWIVNETTWKTVPKLPKSHTPNETTLWVKKQPHSLSFSLPQICCCTTLWNSNVHLYHCSLLLASITTRDLQCTNIILPLWERNAVHIHYNTYISNFQARRNVFQLFQFFPIYNRTSFC